MLSHSSVVAMFLILAEPQTLHHGISAVMTNREENGESGPVATDLTVQVNTSIPSVSLTRFPVHFSESANYVQVSNVSLTLL